MSHPVPSNEASRLAALQRYQILDTAPEEAYDDITKLASHICGTPISFISLVDEKRQWFKSKIGLSAESTPREQAFCAHTIMENKMLVVEDALRDDRFANNALVLGDPHVRFYAGSPLVTSDGLALGSLCVFDRQPRVLSPEQSASMEILSRLVMKQMELREISSQLAQELANVKTLQELLPICSYCKKIRSDDGYWQAVETYFATHSNTDFTHGICPDCYKIHLPEFAGET